jgi:prepilin-type N-terminal cleavage/methylation domain-containing protein
MSKRYTEGAEFEPGFTLLELLIVMALAALILGITLPRMTLSGHTAFGETLERAFRYASLMAVSGHEDVELQFDSKKIKVLDRERPYPEGIRPDRPFRIKFSPQGFIQPQEFLFFRGREKITVKIGLFGVKVE